MLEELRVRELGLIADLDVVFASGLTALTGETGAGKTLVVEALELVVGGRADPGVVRTGADEAVIEARFADGTDEVVLRRVVPRQGRSRSVVNDEMAPLSTLERIGAELVDLHGQHAHQSLLRPGAQRALLDEFAGVDLSRLRAIRAQISTLNERLAMLGGDDRERNRELDLLRYELDEIDTAMIEGADEDERLCLEEERLSKVSALKVATTSALMQLDGDGSPGAAQSLSAAIESLGRHALLEGHRARLLGLVAELSDATSELRREGEALEEDPARLEFVRERRERLRRLMKKHGQDLAGVLAERTRISLRIEELESAEEAREGLFVERQRLAIELDEELLRLLGQRREAAARLSPQVEAHLFSLALSGARFVVEVGQERGGDDVEFLLSTNRGEPLAPLTKVASGGELARAMLAIRLVLTNAPPTLVFDEVDAGIGGQAARAVAEALSKVATRHQVLVVTHLAQVAAIAEHHLVVEKHEDRGRTITTVREVSGEERVLELSRMLSGRPDSASAKDHARELLGLVATKAKRATRNA